MSNPIKRKLIEVALPLETINTEASNRKRKAPAGYPTSIHRWWAQRPLAACRAVLFASLVDDPSSHPDQFPTAKSQDDERQRLFAIIEQLIRWENSSNETVLGAARAEIERSTNGTTPHLLDPFAGGGSIPLEAQRLGLGVNASDLNPVAVLINKALVELPPRFRGLAPVHPLTRTGMAGSGSWQGAAGMAEDVLRYGAWMRQQAEERIGHLFPDARLPSSMGGGTARIVAWLWARAVRCPNPACGGQMPLVRSFSLATKKGNEAWLEPKVNLTSRTVTFSVRSGPIPPQAASGSGTVLPSGKKVRASFTCLICQSGTSDGAYIDSEAAAGRLHFVPLALVASSNRRRVYLPWDSAQQLAVDEADRLANEPDFASRLPNQASRGTFASNAQGRAYGFREFKDYFTSRQLVTMVTLTDLVGEVHTQISEAAGPDRDGAHYADAIATYLALAISRVADYGNSLASWRPKDSAMRALFSRQAIPIVWDFAEGSPFGDSSSGLTESIEVVARTLAYVPAEGVASVQQADAAALDDAHMVLISTDPPYYENIGYADLADFFYVWLRRSIGAIYPELFATMLTPKKDELVASPYRFGGSRDAANRHFESGLARTFKRFREVADPSYPLTVYYALKQVETEEGDDGEGPATASTGWETMLSGLLEAGFAIEGTWPMRTEGDNRQVGVGRNALASSIVLVCRPRRDDAAMTDRRGFLSALQAELPLAVRVLQRQSIAPADLGQAAIGPGMSVFSRFVKVIEPNGSRMTVRTALGVINNVLAEVMSEQEDEFDNETRWAVAWFEQTVGGEGSYGTAHNLFLRFNTAENALKRAGIVQSGGGKVRLLRRDELEREWDPTTDKRLTVWEVTQHLIRALEEGGEPAAADLVRKVGGLADTARDLAYRLYAICERKKWAEEALGYNALVTAWPEITRLAASTPGNEGPQQTRLFQ